MLFTGDLTVLLKQTFKQSMWIGASFASFLGIDILGVFSAFCTVTESNFIQCAIKRQPVDLESFELYLTSGRETISSEDQEK